MNYEPPPPPPPAPHKNKSMGSGPCLYICLTQELPYRVVRNNKEASKPSGNTFFFPTWLQFLRAASRYIFVHWDWHRMRDVWGRICTEPRDSLRIYMLHGPQPCQYLWGRTRQKKTLPIRNTTPANSRKKGHRKQTQFPTVTLQPAHTNTSALHPNRCYKLYSLPQNLQPRPQTVQGPLS